MLYVEYLQVLDRLGIPGPLIKFRRRQLMSLSPERKIKVLEYLKSDFIKTDSFLEVGFIFDACTQGYRMWDELEFLIQSLVDQQISEILSKK